MTTLLLVRHGTTEWIERGRLHGISESPLSARGREEARLAAQALTGQHFDAFYTSPLGRARETAAIIAEVVGLAPVPMDDLQEMNFGWMEGGPNVNFARLSPVRRALRSTWLAAVAELTGEGRRRFGQRVAQAAQEIARRHPGQRVLAVVHMGVRNHILAQLVARDPRAWSDYNGWPACAFTELEIDGGGPARILQLNQIEHLNNHPGRDR